jgi:hypothetical protein
MAARSKKRIQRRRNHFLPSDQKRTLRWVQLAVVDEWTALWPLAGSKPVAPRGQLSVASLQGARTRPYDSKGSQPYDGSVVRHLLRWRLGSRAAPPVASIPSSNIRPSQPHDIPLPSDAHPREAWLGMDGTNGLRSDAASCRRRPLMGFNLFGPCILFLHLQYFSKYSFWYV